MASPMDGLMAQAPPEAPAKASQDEVVYMTGDQGPFRCDHCIHYINPGSCEIVDGAIDPAGCCNAYESNGSNVQGQDQSLVGITPGGGGGSQY